MHRMTPAEQLDNFAITQQVAAEAAQTRDEFRQLDKRVGEFEMALRGVIDHWREFGHMMIENKTDYGFDERLELIAKMVGR